MRSTGKKSASRSSFSLSDTLDFDLAFQKGENYKKKMPLSLDIETNVVLEEKGGTTEDFSIQIDLFYYLIQLEKICDGKQLSVEKERVIKNLQNDLFIILANDKYYKQAMEALKKHIEYLIEAKALGESLRDEFLSILMPIQSERELDELSSKEINKLCELLDPNHGKIPADIPPLLRGGTFSIADALFRDKANINDDKESTKFQINQTPFQKAESEVIVVTHNFRVDPDAYMACFNSTPEEIAKINKLEALRKIFTGYEKQLKESWISNGKASKLSDVAEIIGLLKKEDLELIEQTIDGKKQNLSGKRENCATFFANTVQAGARSVCSFLGRGSVNSEEKKSNGGLAIEKAYKVLRPFPK